MKEMKSQRGWVRIDDPITYERAGNTVVIPAGRFELSSVSEADAPAGEASVVCWIVHVDLPDVPIWGASVDPDLFDRWQETGQIVRDD